MSDNTTEVNKNTREYAKTVSKQLKEYCKKGNSFLGFLCSDRNYVNMTAGTKYPYITLIRRGSEIDSKTREIALKTIYGDDYTCNSNWIAGNVSRFTISMKPHQWEQFIITHKEYFRQFD